MSESENHLSTSDTTKTVTESVDDAQRSNSDNLTAAISDSTCTSAPPTGLLAQDPFGNEASKLLFDAIDQLRGCGAGQDLDLPQLVIVGKQSAGKSSLLQSLTDIPFPVGVRLCTRFATRIISRRTPPGTPDMVHVSIETGDINPFGYPNDDTRTGSFNPSISAMTAEAFELVVQQATEAMGISTAQTSRRKNFSSNVLKIELSGPGRSHFGILDVPGIFGTPMGGVTTEEMNGVTAMVTSYMKQPQNIIICVADATDDVVNQHILNLAATHVDSSRMVGVFTKCDLTRDPTGIVQIVKNNEGISGKPLSHGWYVVQNRDCNSPSSFDGEMAEKETFSKAPWPEIPQSRRGTSMLKKFLAELLCRRIREAFPGMESTVDKLLVTERDSLMKMGDPRPTRTQQQMYLISIAQKFRALIVQTLSAPENLPSDEMKLRVKTARAKDRFSKDMTRNGHFYSFLDISGTREESISGDYSDSDSDSIHGYSEDNEDETSHQETIVNSRMNPGQELYREIRTQIHANQGEELLGMLNPAVLKPLLQKQASKWPKHAMKHLKIVAYLTRKVVIIILQAVCTELGTVKYTKNELEKTILQFTTDSLDRARSKFASMWREEETLHLQTNNPQFIKNVKNSQLLRFEAALQRYKSANPPVNFLCLLAENQDATTLAFVAPEYETWTIIKAENVRSLFKELHPRHAINTEHEIHDLLKAYYEVAREDFIYYVNRHIIEPFLLDSQGPLMGLSTEYILGLSDDRIEELGGEDETVITQRKEITAKVERLEAAKMIASQTLRRTRALDG